MFDLPTPELKFYADLSVQVDKPQEVGATVHGQRRVIPILGGDVQGDGWTARVLRGGADFQMIVNQSLAELDARYVLETDAGDLIFGDRDLLSLGGDDDAGALIELAEQMEEQRAA